MRDVRSDRGGYEQIIAAAVAALVVMAAPGASAQSNPATTPTELAIDAAVPMPEPANTPPPSPADFNNLARGLATGEPVKTEQAKTEQAKTEQAKTEATKTEPGKTEQANTETKPAAASAPVTTA